MTQGDLVISMDQLLSKPRLGTCHKFYVQPFTLANGKSLPSLILLSVNTAVRLFTPFFLSVLSDEVKTLMFFEGCPPHLGCSIKLRGASEYELARVKEIIMLMMCVAYHSQLEISFLMDEFAMPPSLAQSTSLPCLLEGSSTLEEADREERGKETNEDSQEAITATEDSALGGQSEEDRRSESSETSSLQDKLNAKSPSSVQGHVGNTETVTSSPFSTLPAPHLSVSPPFLIEEDEEMTHSDPAIRVSEGEMEEDGALVKGESLSTEDGEGSETPTPRLFRDPLQDDTGMFVTEHVASSDDRLKTISAVFKQELKDIILCISPFITFKEPFLLTPAGMHCPSRDYFPEQVQSLVVLLTSIVYRLDKMRSSYALFLFHRSMYLFS